MPHTKETSLPTAEQLDMERRRLRYKRRYNRTLRSTVAILIVVAALAVLAATLWMPVLRVYGSSMAPTLHNGEILVSVRPRTSLPAISSPFTTATSFSSSAISRVRLTMSMSMRTGTSV